MKLIVVRGAKKRREKSGACGVITTAGVSVAKGIGAPAFSVVVGGEASTTVLGGGGRVVAAVSSIRSSEQVPVVGVEASAVAGALAARKLVGASSGLGGLVVGGGAGKMLRLGVARSLVGCGEASAMERLGVSGSWLSGAEIVASGPVLAVPVFQLPERRGGVVSSKPSLLHLTEKAECRVWPVMQGWHSGSAAVWSGMSSAWMDQAALVVCDVWPLFSAAVTGSILHGHEGPWVGSASARMGEFQLFQEVQPLYNLLEVTGGNLMFLGLAVLGAAAQLPRLRAAMMRYIAVGYANPLYYVRERLLPVVRADVARSLLGSLAQFVYRQAVEEHRVITLAPPIVGRRDSWIVQRSVPLNVLLTTVSGYSRDAILVSGLLSGMYSASMFEACAEDLWSEWWERGLSAMIRALGAETVDAVRGVYNIAAVRHVVVERRVRRFVREVIEAQPPTVRKVVERGFRAVDLGALIDSAVKYSYAYRRLISAGLLVSAAYAELARAAEVRTLAEAVAEYDKLVKRGASLVEVLLKRARAGSLAERVAVDMATVIASTMPALGSMAQSEVVRKVKLDPTPASFFQAMTGMLERMAGTAIGFSMAVAKALELLGLESSVNVYWMFYELTARSLGVETKDVVGAVVGKLLPKEAEEFFRQVVLAESPYVEFLTTLLAAIPIARAGAEWLSEFIKGLKRVLQVGGSPVPLPGTVLGQFLLEMRRKLVSKFVFGTKRAIDGAIQRMLKPFTTAPTCPLVDPEVLEMAEWLVFRGEWIDDTTSRTQPTSRRKRES